MNVGGLSSVANRAVNAISEISSKVEDVAETVAAGVTFESSNSDSKQAEVSREITKLPGLRQEAAANARVVATTETLLAEIGSLPRK